MSEHGDIRQAESDRKKRRIGLAKGTFTLGPEFFEPTPCYNLPMDDIRWLQRFQNFERAYQFLSQAVARTELSALERAGVIQSFEFTFELAWNTVKDYLSAQGIDAPFPREALKLAYAHDLLDNGELWLDMLDKRNLMAHSYDEERAQTALNLIRSQYFFQLTQLVKTLGSRVPPRA